MNSKNKVIVAEYTTYAVFKIPKEYENLEDKTIVEDYHVRYSALYIKPVGKDWIKVEVSLESEADEKRPDFRIEDRSDWGFDDSDDEEEEQE
jgi:hypothetical protein